MSFSIFDSPLYAGLMGDAEMASLFSDEAEIVAMIEAESALAKVQARLGLLPAQAAQSLISALAKAEINPADLAAGIARDGVSAPSLVAVLRKSLEASAGAALHFGATSQDIADLALLLRLKRALDVIETRLARLIQGFATLAAAHRATICLARTRSQQAAPTVFGLKAANWLAPLLRHRSRLAQMRQRLLVVQLGGATGTLSALGAEGLAVMDALADALALGRAEPWHTARDRIEELASFLAMLTGSLGTFGADLVILAQSEIGEVGFEGAGGSSTLPQKQNPVSAEILVALARFNANQVSGVHQAAIHTNERDGAAWTLEWLTLPPMLAATGAALQKTEQVLAALRLDPKHMMANLDASQGLVLAEAASFALSAHLDRAEAQAITKRAVQATLASGRHLFDEIAALHAAPIDWQASRSPIESLHAAQGLIDRILAQV